MSTQPDARRCPDHLVEALQRYIHEGIPTGSFLHAVLANNLMQAYQCADLENVTAMPHIVAYVYNHTPAMCHGSEERVARWLAEAGARRRKSADPETPPEAA